MLYQAIVDDDSLLMFHRVTGEQLDVVAVMPDHESDLQALVNMVPIEMLGDLALMAMRRAARGIDQSHI